MSLQKHRGRMLGLVGVLLLALDLFVQAGTEDQATVKKAWRELGRQVWFRWGTQRGFSAEWLNRELDGVDPDSVDAVRTAEFVVAEALDFYGQDTIIVEGRIPLDVNPHCILGLCTMESFPNTRLADWGRRQLHQCVEQACLTTMLVSRSTWRTNLEARTLAADQAWDAPFQGDTLTKAEAPYLYHYLAENASSADARNLARRRLAHCLWQGYGLESGLRQCLVLSNQGCMTDEIWREAIILGPVGSHATVKKLYEHWLANADSQEQAQEICEHLVGVFLCESRYRQASAILEQTIQRFPQAKWTAPEITGVLKDFQENRAQARQRFSGELIKATRELQVLQWCRLLDALWGPEDASGQWHALLKETSPGTLAEQCARVFLARALLGAGQIAEAEAIVQGLSESVNPFVQAQNLAVSAELAHAKDQERESVRLYAKAIQKNRPTSLPSWCRECVPTRLFATETSEAGLRAQRCFLKGYQDLIDGDFAAAIDSLNQVAADPQFSDDLRCVLPCMLMLAHLGVADYTEAEACGYQALEQYRKDHPEDRRVLDLLSMIQNLDKAVSQLVAVARDEAANHPDAGLVSEQAIHVYDACTNIGSCEPLADVMGKGLQPLYVQACRRRYARLLMAEHRYICQQTPSSGMDVPPVRSEPLWFTAQLLTGDSLDEIGKNLASGTEEEEAQNRMYRFAVFAMKAKQLDFAAAVLDVGAGNRRSADNTALLEEIGDQYLAASNPQKAVDFYLRVAATAQDPNKSQAMRLKVIEVYTDSLKDYDKAIRQCEDVIRKYPDNPEISQLEFRIGKLAYLKRDYSGAASQLIAFQKRYPEHAELAQAAMLVGLSRMAEGNTQEAIGRFMDVIRRHPDGELAAQCKFLIGYAQVSEQQYSAGAETFRQLIEQFPDSPYVERAEKLLDRLNKVSR